jgi:indole-3-glycerol phosphate synthase
MEPMILDEILEKKKKRISEAKHRVPRDELIAEAHLLKTHKRDSFLEAISKKDRLCTIAEVKKASPSKGILSFAFDYLKIAQNYEKNGACAISVLTEEDFFMGSNQILREIRGKVSIPILRKDFVVDPYQIYESKAMGADAILLICRILPLETLKEFYRIATELNLDCLFEVHNEEEIIKAIEAGARIIGINNRDLDTFRVDLHNSERLFEKIPEHVVKVSESGISTLKDMAFLSSVGFDAVLVGEACMRMGMEEELKTFMGYGKKTNRVDG